MGDFKQAHAFVRKWEGGFDDHPNDPGGVTNYGVSLAYLKDHGLDIGDINDDGVIDRKDILAMTPEKAAELVGRIRAARQDRVYDDRRVRLGRADLRERVDDRVKRLHRRLLRRHIDRRVIRADREDDRLSRIA